MSNLTVHMTHHAHTKCTFLHRIYALEGHHVKVGSQHKEDVDIKSALITYSTHWNIN